MGVQSLWKALRAEEGLVVRVRGSDGDAGQHRVATEVDGRVVAVDLAQWVVQASEKRVDYEHLREARCVRVAFERAVNWLRYGCLPVGVVEGRAPPEKRALQQQRLESRYPELKGMGLGGGGNWEFNCLLQRVADLLRALGLPVFVAPGEAEATCAALDAAGLADACATADADALLFGARCVFSTLRLTAAAPRESEVERADMPAVRRLLGLAAGGAGACTALALLAGGDYDLGGAHAVGRVGALRVVKHLLTGRQDDEGVLRRLRALVAAGADPAVEGLVKCTGCKRCKHEGGRKDAVKHHGLRNPCAACVAAGSCSEDGRCAELPGAACGCEFHRREGERAVARVVGRAHATPGFAESALAAEDAYGTQAREAAAAVRVASAALRVFPGERLAWRSRPDPAKAHACMDAAGMRWAPELVRRKMRPLVMEYDATHPGPQAEFVPVRIAKLAGQRAAVADSAGCWRYLLEWRRTDVGDPAEVAADRHWLSPAPTARQKGGPANGENAAEGAAPATPARRAHRSDEESHATSEARSLRCSAIQEHWPALVSAFNERRAADLAKARNRRRMAKTDGNTLEGMQAAMARFAEFRARAALFWI
ncbi:hypothetical protein WJX81_006968 [Elliptochloris bilobata]|uniref:XPG-I domain-containing protein n=1 Tax=Elliptochloris bilobata TaxID=381761 RepID=A0AAW1S233_9CHLO